MPYLKFTDIYPDATILSEDFLKNECGMDLAPLKPKEQQIVFQDYYLNMCKAIKELHYLRMSPQTIEDRLNNPYVGSGCCCTVRGLYTEITNPDERKYIFLKATADQLRFDRINKRTAMIRGADKNWLISPDVYAALDQLGFVQRTYAMKR